MHDPRDTIYPFHASLKEFRWKNRPLVIFAPSDRNDDYAEQLQKLEGAAKGLADRSLRDKYGVDGQQFVVLLIGKDGGAKLRAEEPVTTTEFFSLKGID